jgi:hypothetical protein
MSCLFLLQVLYTKGAMCSAAGLGSGGKCEATPTNLAKIEGVITLAVAETNKAYELSGIPTKFRLVKTHFDSTYDDYTNQWEATLGNLRNNGDGQLDYVHAMRDQYGADFVAMLVDTGSYCGIGYRPSTPTAGDAFSLTQWNCATGYYSFGHEIGHNMGCNHDKASSGETTGTNFGYRDPSAKFRSILAYDCSPSCPRIQYFSKLKTHFMSPPTTITILRLMTISPKLLPRRTHQSEHGRKGEKEAKANRSCGLDGKRQYREFNAVHRLARIESSNRTNEANWPRINIHKTI